MSIGYVRVTTTAGLQANISQPLCFILEMSVSQNSGKSRGGELEDVLSKGVRLSAMQDSAKVTKSLGRNVVPHISQQYPSTTTSSDDDSDTDEEERQARFKTRSLGRNEVNTGNKRASSFIPVSERSAAYRELVMSSSPSSNYPCKTPTSSSIMRLRNHTSASRIEANPFFQQDRLGGRSQTMETSKSLATLEPLMRSKSSCADSSSSASPSSVSSPSRSGVSTVMSVQMRIRIWKEKEAEAKGQVSEATKLQNRKSLQQVAHLGVVHLEPKAKEDGKGGAHSDDEVAKGSSKLGDGTSGHANHGYEVIDNIVGKSVRLAEASSCSSLSSESGTGEDVSRVMAGQEKRNGDIVTETKLDTGGRKKSEGSKKRSWNPLNRILKTSKEKKRKQSSKSNSFNRSSPSQLNKRPHNKSRGQVEAEVSKEDEGLSSADDVFSPVRTNGTCRVFGEPVKKNNDGEGAVEGEGDKEAQINHVSSVEEQRKVKSCNGNKVTFQDKKEARSISSDIRSIINSLGASEENSLRDLGPPCTILVDENSNSNSGSDDEEEDEETNIMSSLDIKKIGRQALKRRASDCVKSMTGTKKTVAMRKGSLSPYEDSSESVIATSLIHGDAVWDRVALDADELSFRVGDEVEVLDMTDDVWWYGSVEDVVGWFPASFVRLRVSQVSENEDLPSPATPPSSNPKSQGASTESAEGSSPPEDSQRHPPPQPTLSDIMETVDEENSDTVPPAIQKNFPRPKGNSVHRRMTIRRRDSIVGVPRRLSSKEVRGKIVEEILNTEKDYVNHLEDIIEGYLKRCREYISRLFTEEQIEVIFSNIEQVYEFQRDFLRELEARVNKDHLDQSEIGEVFLLNKHSFRVYSQYCNNHPNAVNEMNLLQGNEQYALFFESCRLLRNLQDISLDGFLLTPVQKICRYPLQLSELMKYTSEDHPDHQHVVAAQKAMKEVAMLINEQKRRIENMGKIGVWQMSIDGWKGGDVLEHSSELVHSGELQKISKGHSQERFFFLFDHQLIYCRKDTIGGRLAYKGRFNLDVCQVHDLAEGQALHGSTPVKNSWRMNNTAKDNKSYIIYAKTPQIKEEWMKAFEKERQRVKEDQDRGFEIPMKMKMAAVALSASTSSEAGRRRKSVPKKHITITESVDTVVKLKLDNSGKRLTAPVGGTFTQIATSPQLSKKAKSRNKKLNSVSGGSSKSVY